MKLGQCRLKLVSEKTKFDAFFSWLEKWKDDLNDKMLNNKNVFNGERYKSYMKCGCIMIPDEGAIVLVL